MAAPEKSVAPLEPAPMDAALDSAVSADDDATSDPSGVPEEVEAPPAPVDPSAAWQSLPSGQAGLPAGLGLVLRTSRFVGIEEDVAHVEVPEGPGLDRLSERDIRVAVAKAFSAALGRTVSLEVRAPGSGEDPGEVRITPETVRNGRVQSMVESDPKLGRAVETLDLELME